MFTKLSFEESERKRQELKLKFDEQDARVKLMVEKLEDQIARGFIESEFDVESFLQSCNNRITLGVPLTDKQLAKLEELFERY